jgi:hypothetical protein
MPVLLELIALAKLEWPVYEDIVLGSGVELPRNSAPRIMREPADDWTRPAIAAVFAISRILSAHPTFQ